MIDLAFSSGAEFYAVEGEDGESAIMVREEDAEGVLCVCASEGSEWIMRAFDLARSIEVSSGVPVSEINMGSVSVTGEYVN